MIEQVWLSSHTQRPAAQADELRHFSPPRLYGCSSGAGLLEHLSRRPGGNGAPDSPIDHSALIPRTHRGWSGQGYPGFTRFRTLVARSLSMRNSIGRGRLVEFGPMHFFK